jgi:hypothetical protein
MYLTPNVSTKWKKKHNAWSGQSVSISLAYYDLEERVECEHYLAFLLFYTFSNNLTYQLCWLH